MKSSFLLAVAVAAASLLGASAARAQTVIDYLPYIINNNGLYVLNNNLNSAQADGNLIEIRASNVTVDFQGHYIAGVVGNTAQSAAGVYANEKSNVTIKNGTIAYCARGVLVFGNGGTSTNSVGHLIDNMRVTYCYLVGIYVGDSPASRVTNCQVSQIGYSTAFSAYGIDAAGSGTTVTNCAVNSVTASQMGISFGIAAGMGSFVRQNTISNAMDGVYGGKYQDNLTANCTTPYTGGTDAGGNN